MQDLVHHAHWWSLPYSIMFYYMSRAVRGPITKINQSKCSIAGPIVSKYWTGHYPKWSSTCVFAVFAFFYCVINLLLTKLARDHTGRISAFSLFCMDRGYTRSVLSRPRADIPPVRPSGLVNKIYVMTNPLHWFFHSKWSWACLRDGCLRDG